MGDRVRLLPPPPPPLPRADEGVGPDIVDDDPPPSRSLGMDNLHPMTALFYLDVCGGGVRGW